MNPSTTIFVNAADGGPESELQRRLNAGLSEEHRDGMSVSVLVLSN